MTVNYLLKVQEASEADVDVSDISTTFIFWNNFPTKTTDTANKVIE